MNPLVIGVSGKLHSGKGEVTKILANLHGNLTPFAFAEPLKRGVAEFFGFDHDQVFGARKDEVDPFWAVAPGQILQFYGTDTREMLAEKYPWAAERLSKQWVYMAQRMIEKAGPDRNWICEDMRFPDEADLITGDLEGYTIRVNRNEDLRYLSAEREGVLMRDPKHKSETALDDYERFHFVIDNNGSLEQLRQKVVAVYAIIMQAHYA
jgi:hypothetical protein